MTDWNQIVLRNVRNSPLRGSLDNEIVVDVVLGSLCKTPLLSGMPFLLDLTGGNREEKRALMYGYRGEDTLKLLVSYSACDDSSCLLSRDCILELDGPEIDTGILAAMDIGACFVDLSEVYYNLTGYNHDPLGHPDISRGRDSGRSLGRNLKRIIDLRPFYSRDSHVDQWVSLLRRLRPDIPFGIRIPANYIERDCILAATCEVDFIIIDCPDIIGKESKANQVVPSLPALSRVKRILTRLSCDHISVITGVPSMDLGDYLKLFAMGSDLLMFSCPQDMEHGPGNNKRKEDADLSRAIAPALACLKEAMYQCGCTSLKEAGVKHLLTGSFVISSFTDIAMLYEPDPVTIPFFNIKKKSKEREKEYLS